MTQPHDAFLRTQETARRVLDGETQYKDVLQSQMDDLVAGAVIKFDAAIEPVKDLSYQEAICALAFILGGAIRDFGTFDGEDVTTDLALRMAIEWMQRGLEHE